MTYISGGEEPAITTVSNTIFGVNALCGAGKSYAACRYLAKRILRGEQWIIAGPTAEQSEQFSRDLQAALRELRPKKPLVQTLVTLVNSTELRSWEQEMSVAERLAATVGLANRGRSGRAICITHAALGMLPPTAKPVGWHLMIDEAHTAAQPVELTLPNAFLTQLSFRDHGDGIMRLYASPTDIARYADLVDKLRQKAPELLDRKDLLLGIVRPLRDLERRLACKNWIVAISRDQVECASQLSGRHKIKVNEKGETQVVLAYMVDWNALLTTVQQRWKSVTMMAANLDHTISAITMRKQGFEIIPHPDITKALRYTDAHPNGEGVTILFATVRRASKMLRNTVIEGETLGHHIMTAIEELFPDGNYAWSANKDIPDEALKGQRMPYVSHGLNHFQHHRNVVVLNISNLNQQQMKVMHEIGLTADEVRTAIMAENCYQAALRGASRDPACKDERIIVVMDAETAHYIAGRMPGAKVGELGAPQAPQKPVGRPREHEDDKDRKAAQRKRDDERMGAMVDNFRADCLALTEPHASWPVLIYQTTTSGRSCGQHDFPSFDDMAQWLRMEHSNVIENKADRYLLLAGEVPQVGRDEEVGENWPSYDDGRPKFRGTQNVIARSSLWLDIESSGDGAAGPPMPWESMKQAFAGLRMVGYSSFSNRAEGHRYRVVIPLDHAVGPQTYEALIGLVHRRLAARGWLRWHKKAEPPGGKVRYSGVDWSKKSASSIFYGPCTRAGGEADAWFEDVAGEAVDVAAWLADEKELVHILPAEYQPQAPVPVLPPRPMTRFDRITLDSKVAEAVMDYTGSALQNDGLFRLGWRLAGYGCDLGRIEQELLSAARASRSPADRKNDVPRILADIRRRKRL